MRDLDDAKTKSGGDRNPGVHELSDVYSFPDGKWTTIRLIPGLWSTAQSWVQVTKKDGSKSKFMVPCSSWDAETQDRDSTKYDPWRDYSKQEWQEALEKYDGDKQKARSKCKIQFGMHFWMIALVRSKQKNAPAKVRPTAEEKKTGFKDKESDTWTAKHPVRLSKGLADKVKELKGLNIFEGKSGAKAYSVTDVKYGRDIRVKYDSKKAAGEQYQVQLGEKRTPLTEEELAMLTWDMDTIIAKVMKVGKKADIKADFEGWASRNNVKVKKAADDEDEDSEDGDDGMDEDDEDSKPKKGAKGKKVPPAKKGKASKSDEDDEDEDEDEDFDSEDDDEDEDEDSKPAKGKKAPAKKKSKSDDEDEDEDDEDSEDDDEDDEDSEDDDEDSEDDEDEDEDDDEDSKPARGKGKKAPVKKPAAKKAPAKKKSKSDEDEDEDEDDFDSEDEDEDEDDEDSKPKKGAKAAKGKKPAAKKAPAKGKKKADDDDDEEDDFDEEDEDDEDD